MEQDMKAWLLDKFHEWEKEEGERKSEAKFAVYLGVGKEALNHWLNGRNNPNYKSALKIAQALNDYEILEILGYELPEQVMITDEQLAPLAALIMQFPEEVRPRIRQIMVDVLEKMLETGQPPTEEETLKLMAARILSELEK
jgi:transcriptional regulator with XRE-family HTH domain